MAYYDNPFGAYQHANKTKSHTEQIVMCYCAAISFVQQAKEAHIQGDHATRYELIDKALSVVRGLKACLNFDVAPDVSVALNNYYDTLELMLVSAQCEDNKEEICDNIVDNLRVIQKAWEDINQKELNTSDEQSDESNENLPPPANDYDRKDLHI